MVLWLQHWIFNVLLLSLRKLLVMSQRVFRFFVLRSAVLAILYDAFLYVSKKQQMLSRFSFFTVNYAEGTTVTFCEKWHFSAIVAKWQWLASYNMTNDHDWLPTIWQMTVIGFLQYDKWPWLAPYNMTNDSDWLLTIWQMTVIGSLQYDKWPWLALYNMTNDSDWFLTTWQMTVIGSLQHDKWQWLTSYNMTNNSDWLLTTWQMTVIGSLQHDK